MHIKWIQDMNLKWTNNKKRPTHLIRPAASEESKRVRVLEDSQTRPNERPTAAAQRIDQHHGQ